METVNAVDLTPPTQERFLRRLDWSAFWTAFALSFAVYLYTLAPTVTLEDSGELAVAGDCLGVPHPPGYPIWTMLAFVFTRLFRFVPYLGQPNPAWSIGLLSAVFGAVATAMTAMLICRSGSDLLRASRDTMHKAGHKTEDRICWIGGVVSSLLFAFSPVMWSQAVIVEVYSLNAFFLVLIFLLTYCWMSKPTDRLLYITAFVFGLGLTNYQVLLLAALPLAIAIMLKDLKLFRDFLIAGTPLLAVLYFVNRGGFLQGIVHPTHYTLYLYLSLNVLILVLSYFFLPHGKTVALTILLAELGIAFYLYMPLVSDLLKPLPMNWGYPRTWEGFKHALSRGQYEKIAPADVFSIGFIHQIGDYFADMRVQFTMLMFPVGFLPFTIWQIKAGKRRIPALYVAIGLSLTAIILALSEKFIFHSHGGVLTVTYKALLLAAIALLGVGGTAVFLNQASELFGRLKGQGAATISERIVIGLIFIGTAGAYLVYGITLAGKIGTVTAPLRQAQQALAQGATGQITLQVIGIILLIVAPAVITGLVAWLMRSRFQLKVGIDHNSQQWIIATLVGFLAMSAVLIALANPKGDIQDAFIQKVKFISSHALYAFWIGYGLIFSLAYMDTLFKNIPALRTLTFIAALALPLAPIAQNAFDKELIRVYGGAEQNQHDFGWQFGNYQLRGADAINEELSPDEEPLPNPEFPDEMGPDAVFFGGTDPGRFVPTYMIYGADVRPDVFLITQNALADNTYMAVMRDLYGDDIWIPAQQDSAKAFSRYVEEVQTGKRPKNAELKIEGGRVQVSGALGVMEINGILAEMIFEHNNYKHDFYVEESYVIRWMYPYLEPHGLIMKINTDKVALRNMEDTIRNDLDFWDWYSRRLLNTRGFVRDIVARKSFSKLRSAIAGLYSNQRLFAQAEEAFQEARMLYPLSPEANFRLVQEVYMPFRRFSESTAAIEDFGRQDPGNTKVAPFLEQIGSFDNLYKQVAEYEAKYREKKLQIPDALTLVELYFRAQQPAMAVNVAKGIAATPNLPGIYYYKAGAYLQQGKQYKDAVAALDKAMALLPANTDPQVYLDMVSRYLQSQRTDRAEDPMLRYLRLKQNDWKAWIDLAVLQLQLKKQDQAVTALRQAVQHGGSRALSIIQTDKRFAPVLQKLGSGASQRTLMGLPGITPRNGYDGEARDPLGANPLRR